MKRRMSAAEARVFVNRWQTANAAEIKELRATSPTVKLRQLAALMLSADSLGPDPSAEAEKREVWQRWMKLRKAYGV